MPSTLPVIEKHAQVVRIVMQACIVCRHVQSRLDQMRSMTKDDASPVTIADYASQAVVARGLANAGILRGGLIAEESADFLKQPEHATHRAACIAALRESGVWADCTESELIDVVDLGCAPAECLREEAGGWTLDPIDGTKGFLRGQQYCVSLGLIERGQPTLGLLGCPNLSMDPHRDVGEPDEIGSLFLAAKGSGVRAWSLNNMSGAEAISIARPADRLVHVTVAESYEAAHSSHSESARVAHLAAQRAGVTVNAPLRMDSQAKYAVVARGQADIYLRLPSRKGYIERIWDHAAGTLVASEAGCVVSDALGKPLDFSCGRGLDRNQGIVAAPAEIHARIIEAIRELRPS